MKCIIAGIFCLFIASCSKETGFTDKGTIECKVNGVPVVFKTNEDRTQTAQFYKQLPSAFFGPTTRYVVDGFDSTKQNVIAFYFDTDTLKTGVYVLDFGSGGNFLNTIKIDTSSSVTWPGDEITFIVTAISSDRLSGTFSGFLSPANGSSSGTVIITEGKVNNLRIRD